MPKINNILDFLKHHSQALERPSLVDQWTRKDSQPDCPRQQDNVSCGVFVCAFAELVVREVDPQQRRIEQRDARQTIVKVLRWSRFDNEEFSIVEASNGRSYRPSTASPEDNIDLCSPERNAEVENTEIKISDSRECPSGEREVAVVGLDPPLTEPEVDARVDAIFSPCLILRVECLVMELGIDPFPQLPAGRGRTGRELTRSQPRLVRQRRQRKNYKSRDSSTGQGEAEEHPAA